MLLLLVNLKRIKHLSVYIFASRWTRITFLRIHAATRLLTLRFALRDKSFIFWTLHNVYALYTRHTFCVYAFSTAFLLDECEFVYNIFLRIRFSYTAKQLIQLDLTGNAYRIRTTTLRILRY